MPRPPSLPEQPLELPTPRAKLELASILQLFLEELADDEAAVTKVRVLAYTHSLVLARDVTWHGLLRLDLDGWRLSHGLWEGARASAERFEFNGVRLTAEDIPESPYCGLFARDVRRCIEEVRRCSRELNLPENWGPAAVYTAMQTAKRPSGPLFLVPVPWSSEDANTRNGKGRPSHYKSLDRRARWMFRHYRLGHRWMRIARDEWPGLTDTSKLQAKAAFVRESVVGRPSKPGPAVQLGFEPAKSISP